MIGLTKEQRAVLAAAKRIKATVRNKAKRERPAKVSPVAKGQRQPRERDNGYLAYLRRQPCEAAHIGGCQGPIQAAHIRYSDAKHGASPGAGRKNHDRNCNPLCAGHHADQHDMSERAFWMILRKDAYETAAAHYARYRTPMTQREEATL